MKAPAKHRDRVPIYAVQTRTSATAIAYDSTLRPRADGKRRQVWRTFDTYEDALAQLEAHRTDRRRGELVTIDRRDKTTIAEYANVWLARQVQLQPSTRSRYAAIIRTHVVPAFGSIPLTKIERSAVAAWVTELVGAGLAGPTVRHIHRVLYMILGSAVADDRIKRNVAEGMPLPSPTGREKRFLDHEQVAALARAAGDGGTVIRTLAYCGLRFGELAALRVRNVDMLRRRLTIAESATEVDGIMVFGPPKSHRTRSVPVPRSLVDDLAHRCRGKRPDALVFTAPAGGVLYLRNWRRRVFDPAARTAGLDGLTPHDLRHTAASLAVAAGANVKAVQRMLGHASAAMTLDVYSGLFDDDLDAVADRLDEAATQAAR